MIQNEKKKEPLRRKGKAETDFPATFWQPKFPRGEQSLFSKPSIPQIRASFISEKTPAQT
jgi:hypothetical protein